VVGGDLADITLFTIVTYERRPGHWRAAVTPVRRSGAMIGGCIVSSLVTPDDFSSEQEAKSAAEKIITRL
jgi:hypothetical protein